MRLIDNCNKNPHKHVIERVDRVFESVGLSQKNAYEFSSENISDFNQVAVDSPDVDYYSVGAQKKPFKVNDILRFSQEIIYDGYVQNRSDGVVMPEEAAWGSYLVTFEQDHLEMAGFNVDYTPNSVYRLLLDNVKLHEIKSNP